VLSFACPVCRALVFFENSRCVTCGSALGFDRGAHTLVAVADPPGGEAKPCANATIARCNWLAGPHAPGGLCDACLLTRTRPNDADLLALSWFARAEEAKRRLVFQLDDLGLAIVSRRVDPEHGLAFDLLSSEQEPVVTGHASGLVTIDLAEGEDGHREAMRVRLAEPYRTMLGHFRHEVGHWYWERLVQDDPAEFRALFGDERVDYRAALDRHYASDPQPGWQESFVSVYASAHPWEDWAETFAHYLHIRDTLQTAAAFNIGVRGPDAPVRVDPDAPLVAVPTDHPRDFDRIMDTWLPLTYALNAVNRSMGKDDLYPFVLSPTVLDKLHYVHTLVNGTRPERAIPSGANRAEPTGSRQ
jgi:hypothetical protein